MERFAAAAQAGFRAVECLFPYEHSPAAVAQQLQEHHLVQALFNLPPGDWQAGECGLAALAGRESEFRASIETALLYAHATGAQRLHAMAGIGSYSNSATRGRYADNIAHAADRLAQHGLDLLIEPINSRDIPGYFLNDFGQAEELIHELNRPNLKLQYDIYHRQVLHGDVVRSLEQLLPLIGHIQIASVPDRQEPNTGELDDDYLFGLLDRLPYTGYVGCEYRPAGTTQAGLRWLQRWPQ